MVEPRSSGPTCLPETSIDVAVIGAGVGGLAAGVHLGRAGRHVLCIEPVPFPHDRVGESLDWSSPGMLAELGIPPEELIRDGVATHKRNIEIVTRERPVYTAAPSESFRKPPLRFEVVTLHVDRFAMDQRLHDLAKRDGVEFLHDRAVAVEIEDGRVCSVTTESGRRITARWFIDASGRGSRFLARKFGISKTDYGRKKVCVWTHFDAGIHNEGTTFYADSMREEYISWIWEIPITPRKASVGCVMSAEYVGQQRQQGKDVRAILWERLGRFDRFKELLATQTSAPLHRVSYRTYVYDRPCGPNWLIVGEAATLVDPLTANGVTAAFRHATEGVQFILESWERGQFTRRQKAVYTANLTRMGHVFNHSIETAIYDWPIRWGLGAMPAQKVYTYFSYTINALYSRIRPKSRLTMCVFWLLLTGVWLWMEGWSALGRLSYGCRRLLSLCFRKKVFPQTRGSSGPATEHSRF